jgi:cation transport ATPase
LVGTRLAHCHHAARTLAGDEGHRPGPRRARRTAPDDAERITDSGDTETVAIADLVVGNRLLVRSGSRIPADGTIVERSVEVNESMLTGESNPVAKAEGDKVVAGSVATDNSIRIEVTAIGDDTAVGGIQRLVADAQNSKSKAQALADRAAAALFRRWVAPSVGCAVERYGGGTARPHVPYPSGDLAAEAVLI